MTNIEIEDLRGELLSRIERGGDDEIIQLCQDGQPIGVIRFLGRAPGASYDPRPVGLDAGIFTVPPEFFDPQPDDLLAEFNGEGP